MRIDNFINNISNTLDTKLRTNNFAIVGFTDVKVGEQNVKIGDVIVRDDGLKGRVNADGSITILSQ